MSTSDHGDVDGVTVPLLERLDGAAAWKDGYRGATGDQENGTIGPVFRSLASPCVPSSPRYRSTQQIVSLQNTFRDNRFVLAAVSVS